MAFTNDSLAINGILTYQDAEWRIKDISPWVAEGISLDDVKGNYKATLVDTGEVFHENTDWNDPDIEQATSLESEPVAYPTESESDIPLQGTVQIDYTAQRSVTALPSGITGDLTLPYLSTVTVAAADVPGIEAGDEIVLSGWTNPENNGTFTIESIVVNGADLELKIPVMFITEAGDVGKELSYFEYYEKTFLIPYEFVKPVASLQVTHSCKTYSLISKDTTSGVLPTTLTREHRVSYPDALGPNKPPDVVSTTAIVVVGPPIYTGIFTSYLTRTTTYVTGILTVELVDVAAETHNVTCLVKSICCFMPAIAKIRTKFVAETKSAGRSYYLNMLLNVEALISEVTFYEECGKTAQAEAAFAELKLLLEREDKDLCNCGCGDSGTDGLPQLLSNDQYTVIGASAVSVVPFETIVATNAQAALEEIFALIIPTDPGTLDKQMMRWDQAATKIVPGQVFQDGEFSGQVPVYNQLTNEWVPGSMNVEEVVALDIALYTNPDNPAPVNLPAGFFADGEGVKISGYGRGTTGLAVIRLQMAATNHDLAIQNTTCYFEIIARRDGGNLILESSIISVNGGTPSPAPSTTPIADWDAVLTIALSTLSDSIISGVTYTKFRVA